MPGDHHMQKTSSKKPIAVYGAIASNLIIAIFKYIVAFLTGSSAMLSEGIHSTADTGNELLLLLGLRTRPIFLGFFHS